MVRKLALMAIVGATLMSATSAFAQIQGDPFGPLRQGYGRQAPPPPDYQPPRQRYQPPPPQGYDRGYDRRGPRPGYDDPYRPRRGRLGDFCATSRGACQTPPMPVGSNCRCNIDGLPKRGIIQ